MQRGNSGNLGSYNCHTHPQLLCWGSHWGHLHHLVHHHFNHHKHSNRHHPQNYGAITMLLFYSVRVARVRKIKRMEIHFAGYTDQRPKSTTPAVNISHILLLELQFLLLLMILGTSWGHADADTDARSYTSQSVPSSLGRYFFLMIVE